MLEGWGMLSEDCQKYQDLGLSNKYQCVCLLVRQLLYSVQCVNRFPNLCEIYPTTPYFVCLLNELSRTTCKVCIDYMLALLGVF